MARYDLKLVVHQLRFLGIRRIYTKPQVTTEAISFRTIMVLTCKTPQNDHENLTFVKDKH